MKYFWEIESENGGVAPELPSFVDVVFILLIFFLVLSMVGFGVVQKGSQSDGIFTKEQNISNFPAVPKALHKEMKEFIILSLEISEQGVNTYHLFSDREFQGIVISSHNEYQLIRKKVENNPENFFEGAVNSLVIFESTWGPFQNIAVMRDSPLVRAEGETSLIIQANRDYTYHDILEVMRAFNNYKSIFFEVIENAT